MHVKTTIGAGQRIEFVEQADFFRILSASQPITVEIYRHGAEVSEAVEIGAGYAEKIPDGFDKIAITSATAQTIQFVTRIGGDVRYDTPPTGNVTITNTAGAFTHAAPTITSASAQLRPANSARRYLLIQNNDASGDIFVRLDGAAATAANGIKVASGGGSYELQGFVPNGAITAIGSIASNANVIVVEG